MSSSISHSFSLYENLLSDSEYASKLIEAYKEVDSLSKDGFKLFKNKVLPLKKNLTIYKKSQLYTLSAVTCYFKKLVDSHALNVGMLIVQEHKYKGFLKTKKISFSLVSSTSEKITNQFPAPYNPQE